MKQLESDFQQRIINLNKFQTELTEKVQNRYLDYLIDTCFHRIIDILFYCLKIRMIGKYKQDTSFEK